MVHIVEVKSLLKNRDLLSILAESVYNPTEEKLVNRADKYITNPNIRIYAAKADKLYLGIIVVHIYDNSEIEIRDIAVSAGHQKSGIGSSLINYCIQMLHPIDILAETDDDAVGFYKRFGFKIMPLGDKYGSGIMRYQCTLKCIY